MILDLMTYLKVLLKKVQCSTTIRKEKRNCSDFQMSRMQMVNSTSSLINLKDLMQVLTRRRISK